MENKCNAVTKVMHILKKNKTIITNAPAIQALDLVVYVIFVVTVSRQNVTLENIYKKASAFFVPNSTFQHFRHLLYNRKPQQMKN